LIVDWVLLGTMRSIVPWNKCGILCEKICVGKKYHCDLFLIQYLFCDDYSYHHECETLKIISKIPLTMGNVWEKNAWDYSMIPRGK